MIQGCPAGNIGDANALSLFIYITSFSIVFYNKYNFFFMPAYMYGDNGSCSLFQDFVDLFLYNAENIQFQFWPECNGINAIFSKYCKFKYQLLKA
jgi:hypothetical protein